jgi:hypothetical protein
VRRCAPPTGKSNAVAVAGGALEPHGTMCFVECNVRQLGPTVLVELRSRCAMVRAEKSTQPLAAGIVSTPGDSATNSSEASAPRV